MAAGSTLCEAKDLCKHGEWLPFLKEAGIPERKAQRYMQLSRAGLKPDTVSDLGGIKSALRWVERAAEIVPSQEELLIVTVGDLVETQERIAIVWWSNKTLSILNLDPRSEWADSLARPLLPTRKDILLSSLSELFSHRSAEMEFCLVPKNIGLDPDVTQEIRRWLT
jgi:hypothetical protein